ncbi:MAG: glycosyltransferase [Tannerella sp.]|jgi:GT2 family glycosyltransferase|nr:glycosyltransferase [Tannerella sp.]
MDKIAAIVATFNRKDCLKNCLDAIRRQTLSPDAIYIVDNHSTSDTAEMLLANRIIPVNPDMNASEDSVITHQINSLSEPDHGILIKYIYKSKNTGGAGGFCTGMKTAYDDGYDWFWLMDDDGFPTEDGLKQLFYGAKKYNLDYANPLVVNMEDKFLLTFELESNKANIDDYKDVDVVHGLATPFNGTFINRRIPEKIGFIKKEMFIWGDEVEYLMRTKKNGFKVATVTKSIHYHPVAGADERVNVIPFFKTPTMGMLKPTVKNRFYIYYRNKGYIDYTYRTKPYICKIFFGHIFYFMSRLKFADCMNFIIAYTKGCKNQYN